MSQRGLFDTRRYAYESIDPSEGERIVLEHLRQHGPATADEISQASCRDKLYIRPRVASLNKYKLIRPTGETRRNDSGRPAKVWELVLE